MPDHTNHSDGEWTTAGRSASVPGEERADEQIRQDVCDRIMQTGQTDCTKVDVEVLNGIVTIRGPIYSEAVKQDLMRLVQSVAGVRSIEDKLQVD